MQVSLDSFCIREPGIVRGNFNMLSRMIIMAREELGLEYWLSPLGKYTLNDD